MKYLIIDPTIYWFSEFFLLANSLIITLKKGNVDDILESLAYLSFSFDLIYVNKIKGWEKYERDFVLIVYINIYITWMIIWFMRNIFYSLLMSIKKNIL